MLCYQSGIHPADLTDQNKWEPIIQNLMVMCNIFLVERSQDKLIELKETNMKTLFLTAALVFGLLDQTFALAGNPVSGEKENVKKSDSSKVVEVKFEMSIDDQKDLLTVELDGKFDEYSSVSVTNTRGSEFYFRFVKDCSGELTFDLTKLDKGSYFLVLNTDKEIRIKRFVIE